MWFWSEAVLEFQKFRTNFSKLPIGTSLTLSFFNDKRCIALIGQNVFEFRKELGKNLNTDEAPALGAVYQAAFQSKGYKVKKFYIKDANLYPIVVSFISSIKSQSILSDWMKFW